MAGKTTVLSNDLLKLIFNATPIANIADNAGSEPLTNLYISLHTADPGDAAVSGQNTSETAYAGYARMPLLRSSSGWTVSGEVVVPAANVDFGMCSAGSGTITHVGVGTILSGAGKLLYSGTLSSPINYVVGTIPRILTGTTITES